MVRVPLASEPDLAHPPIPAVAMAALKRLRFELLSLALLGAWGLVWGTVTLIRPAPSTPWWTVPLIVLSAVAILAGVGRWHQPLYLVVILSVPAGFALSRSLPASIPVGVVVGILCGTSAVFVHNHYRRRDSGR